MSKLKECSACGNEVSKSAKTCPHCGQDLKDEASFLESIIGLIIIVALVIYFMPSQEESAQKQQETLDNIAYAETYNISPSGEISEIFTMGSDYTDIQRDNAEKELKGKIVQWRLNVYEVNKKSDGKYRVITAGRGQVGTEIIVYTRSEEESAFIESLKTGSQISIKGKITGTFMRSVEIDPAILNY